MNLINLFWIFFLVANLLQQLNSKLERVKSLLVGTFVLGSNGGWSKMENIDFETFKIQPRSTRSPIKSTTSCLSNFIAEKLLRLPDWKWKIGICWKTCLFPGKNWELLQLGDVMKCSRKTKRRTSPAEIGLENEVSGSKDSKHRFWFNSRVGKKKP